MRTVSQKRWLIYFLASMILLVGFGLIIASLVISLNLDLEQPVDIIGISFASSYTTVGALILFYKPGNRIGWIMAGIGLYLSINLFSTEYIILADLTPSRTLPLVDFFEQMRWLWILLVSMLSFLLILYPSGYLPTGRWIWLGWLATIPAIGNIIIVLLPDGLAQQLEPLSNILVILAFLALLLSLAPLTVRYRRSRGIERQQVKWFALAGIVFAISIVGIQILFEIPGLPPDINTLLNMFMIIVAASVPVAVGLTIFKYHLFDIDVIIRRTLVYGALTFTLAAVYFGSVILLQSVFTAVSGQGSAVAIVISTLVIAALFTPLRRRIQNDIDRRFYRKKYDAEKIVAAFGVSLREEVDLEELSVRLLGVVEETMQPESLSLWIKERGK